MVRPLDHNFPPYYCHSVLLLLVVITHTPVVVVVATASLWIKLHASYASMSLELYLCKCHGNKSTYYSPTHGSYIGRYIMSFSPLKRDPWRILLESRRIIKKVPYRFVFYNNGIGLNTVPSSSITTPKSCFTLRRVYHRFPVTDKCICLTNTLCTTSDYIDFFHMF